jgi:uncharacterized protein (TIGR02147 family)
MTEGSRRPNNPARKSSRPDVFSYHDYKEFLRDWIGYRKKTQAGFSVREIASRAQFAVGYLSTILSGDRHISAKSFAKLAPILELAPSELSYLESLIKFITADTQEARLAALERMNANPTFQKRKPNESRIIRYMSKWYHVAIREMAASPNFKMDPQWIQDRLKTHIPLNQIKEAIEFLIDNEFLKVRDDGAVELAEKHLDCQGDVYRNALAQFHKHMFTLAAQSIENTPGTERSLLGHTISIAPEQYADAQSILAAAYAKIQKLPEPPAGKETLVYQIELALFPMTRVPGQVPEMMKTEEKQE